MKTEKNTEYMKTEKKIVTFEHLQSTGSTASLSLTGHWMLLLLQINVAVNSINWLLRL